MSQYLLSVPHDSDDEPTMQTMDPAELDAAMAAAGAIIEELMSTGAFVFAGGLVPPSSAITVDNTGESLSTVDGPFVEAPEYLGGFWVIDVADEEAALGWAARARRRPSAAASRSGPSRCHRASESVIEPAVSRFVRSSAMRTFVARLNAAVGL